MVILQQIIIYNLIPYDLREVPAAFGRKVSATLQLLWPKIYLKKFKQPPEIKKAQPIRELPNVSITIVA